MRRSSLVWSPWSGLPEIRRPAAVIAAIAALWIVIVGFTEGAFVVGGSRLLMIAFGACAVAVFLAYVAYPAYDAASNL